MCIRDSSGADHPVSGGASQTSVDDVGRQDQLSSASRGGDEIGSVQQRPDVGQSGDGQPVPGRDDLSLIHISIWSRDYHRGIFERDGVLNLVDGDVYSSETPWVKPRPEIFLAAAAAVGADPSACVYVGDRSYEDVHGPQSVGMRAVWIPHSDIPADQQVSHLSLIHI